MPRNTHFNVKKYLNIKKNVQMYEVETQIAFLFLQMNYSI